MSTQVITIKVDPITKKQAQNTAEALGLSLSAVLKGFLKQFIRTKSVTFSASGDEKPSKYLLQTIKEAEKNLKEGKHSPVFDNAKDAIAWLHKDHEDIL